MKEQSFFRMFHRWSYTILYIVFVTLTFSACQHRTLEEAVAQANSHCPYDMGQSGKLKSVALEGDYVTFTYEWTQSLESFEHLRTSISEAGDRISMLLSDPDGDTRELLRLIMAEAKGIRYVFQHATAPKPVVKKLSVKALKTILEGKIPPKKGHKKSSVAQVDLPIAIHQANATYPQALGNGIRLDSIELEGNFLVYHSSLEETEVSIKAISDNAESVKKSMLQALTQSGNFLSLCTAHHKGLIFRYHGLKSGKTFGIIISPEEMGQKK